MVATRQVYAKVLTPSAVPAKNYPIYVQHLNGAWSPSGELIAGAMEVFYTDDQGEKTFTLWASEEGDQPSKYRFAIPGQTPFEVEIPTGLTTINLGVLKEASEAPTPETPQYELMITHIISEIEARGVGSAPASTTVLGGVKLSHASSTPSNPVVYPKEKVDELLAAATGADLSAYYTKTQVDTALGLKLNYSVIAGYYTKTETDTALGLKLNASVINNYYTKTEVNSLVGSGVDLTNYYTKTQVDTALGLKLNSSVIAGYYTKTETDTALGLKLNASVIASYYTKDETDTALGLKLNSSVIASYYTKTETDTALGLKLNASVIGGYYTKSEVDTLLAGATGADLTNYYTKAQTDTKLDLKANFADLANPANYYTKTQVDSLVAGVSPVTNLDALTDVVLTSPSNGQTLVYNGSNWVNQTPATVSPGSSGNITSTTYDGQNRLSTYVLNGVTYTVTYGTNTTVITGGGQVRTITRDNNNLLLSDVTTNG